jgi:hypothetical protein
MARFEATITETVRHMEVPAPPEQTAEVRSVAWTGEAADQGGAQQAAYAAWDEKYGAGQRPTQSVVKVTPLAE